MVAADARTAITFSLSPGQAHDVPEGGPLSSGGAGRSPSLPIFRQFGCPKLQPARESEELPSFLQRVLSGESAGQH